MINVHVKHGGGEHVVSGLGPEASVAAVKESVEAQTGVFVRHQKLIYKGKVLEDKATLAAAKVGDGAKLMMLVSANAAQAPKKGAAAPPTFNQSAAPKQAPAGPVSRGPAAASSSSNGGGGCAALSLPERRSNWAKMGVVALRDLGLEAVPPECFEGLGEVRGADLSQNRLVAVPAAISQLGSLATLRLSNNELRDDGLPWDALARLRCLTQLTLDSNRLTRLPTALGGCSGLVRLSAGANQVAEVEDGALRGLSAVRELDLSRNRLAALPETIGCCSSLEDLNACDNELAAIPQDVTRLQRLKSLRLDNNRVKVLPEGLLASCASLAALLLRGNPITIEALRGAPGFPGYEERRRARTDKQLGGRVMSDIERAFCEGADIEQWEHHR